VFLTFGLVIASSALIPEVLALLIRHADRL
jgi:hypothetical protein